MRSQASETGHGFKPAHFTWDEEITACLLVKFPMRCTCSSTAALCEGDSPACSFQYSTCIQSV